MLIPVHEETIQEKKDHEYSRACSELKTIKNGMLLVLKRRWVKKVRVNFHGFNQKSLKQQIILILADYVTNEETIQEKKDPCNHTPKGEICDVHGDKDCSVKEENIEEGKIWKE